jgi:hypothetical protein
MRSGAESLPARLVFFSSQVSVRTLRFQGRKSARAPDGRPLGPDLLVAGRSPVGLILDNLLEVIDEVIRNEEVIEFPQSLLFKNQLIGLWELIDEQLEVEGRPTTN